VASALQNRLIGTIILVALVVIFLPDILDGKKTVNNDVFAEIPPVPDYDRPDGVTVLSADDVTEQAVRKIEVLNEVAVDDPESAQSNNSPDGTEAIDSTPVDVESVGWVVQLGSFRHEKNVRELLNKLEKAGYRSFSRRVTTQSGILTKVFVGPDVDKDKLESALSHLKEVTSLQGKVTPFSAE
jgi:DedD protein